MGEVTLEILLLDPVEREIVGAVQDELVGDDGARRVVVVGFYAGAEIIFVLELKSAKIL